MEVVVITSATLVTSKGVSMRKKRLLIVRVNPIVVPPAKQEEVRQRLIKQLKDGVIVIDKSSIIECYDYDSKQVELKVISQDEDIVVEDTHKG